MLDLLKASRVREYHMENLASRETNPLGRCAHVCRVRRMPRMQVYLPDDLYRELKARGLPASELLQEAVRAELRRRSLLDETDAYLTELIDEVGEPTPAEIARAEAIARRLELHATDRAS
jgi:post-segregation antitoxin (ccd killing protein)